MPEDELAWEYHNRLAVEGVLYDYCERVDACDYEGIAALFTEDCEFDLGFGRVSRGRAAIVEQMSSRLGVDYTHTSHHLSNVRVDFAGRDRAVTRSYVMAWHRQAFDGRQRHLFGRYLDEFVLTTDGWKIHRRRLLMAGEDGYPRAPDRPGPFELIERRGRE